MLHFVVFATRNQNKKTNRWRPASITTYETGKKKRALPATIPSAKKESLTTRGGHSYTSPLLLHKEIKMKILFLFWRTSNCQWAAWRSCLACSRAQPAANTNWLIITCSRSESMAVIVEGCWRWCQLSWSDRCSTLARCLTSRKHEMRKNGRLRRRGGASLVVYTRSALRERLERTWPSTEQNNEASVLFLNGCAAFCVCWGGKCGVAGCWYAPRCLPTRQVDLRSCVFVLESS